MRIRFSQREVALAAVAAIGSLSFSVAPTVAGAAGKTPGKYVSGDFHNHTTCSDGSISMQKLVKKATDKNDTPWGLDWFVQAGHGGNGNRNCTLVEDASLSTRPPTRTFGRRRPADHDLGQQHRRGAVKGDGGGDGSTTATATCGAGNRSRSSSTR